MHSESNAPTAAQGKLARQSIEDVRPALIRPEYCRIIIADEIALHRGILGRINGEFSCLGQAQQIHIVSGRAELPHQADTESEQKTRPHRTQSVLA